MMAIWRFSLGVLLAVAVSIDAGILYPKDSESRQVMNLDGLWKFAVSDKDNQNQGFDEQWYLLPLDKATDVIDMPVPSSYNDITQDKLVRDHIGWAWYQREFFVPRSWKASHVNLRFGSANYYSIVWVNGIEVVQHSGGYLPFQADVGQHLRYGHINQVTVAINNTLTPWTIPQGKIVYRNDPKHYPPGYYEQQYNFDFTNYAGIHRPVFLEMKPPTYIDDITVKTTIKGTTGYIDYSIEIGGSQKASSEYVVVEVYDEDTKLVAQAKNLTGRIVIEKANFWWPLGTNHSHGYLYTLKVQLWNSLKDIEGDVYRLSVGVRQVDWNEKGIFVNGQLVYMKGFGRHEDANLRGRGLDWVTLTKDFNLMRWIGANSFRTSHYPYSEELMDLADRQGFMVIDEVPAVGLDNFDDPLLAAHLQTIKELVSRDKNRPSVVMWSVGNEPQSQKQNSSAYFKSVAEQTQSMDSSRPVTLVTNKIAAQDLAAQFMDVICINRYFSWYSDTGHSELIQLQTINEVIAWHDKHNKPVIVTEYGAGSIAGLHTSPSVVWTEDYQVELMEENFKAFDQLRQLGYLVGEMIWNFADFATPQGVNRVAINRKGVFTRERQPKIAAKVLKLRYDVI